MKRVRGRKTAWGGGLDQAEGEADDRRLDFGDESEGTVAEGRLKPSAR